MINANIDLSNTFLETNRLLIRPWKQSDLQDFYEYAKVDGVGQMAGWTPHASIEESQKILSDFIHEKNVFAIQLKENEKVIGSLGLEKLTIDLGEPYTDMTGREVGYVLSKPYWGRGIMPEAVERVISFCFEEEHFDFLLCSHNITNEQSRRVIEKCGFEFIKENSRMRINGEEAVSRYYVLWNENEKRRL